MDNQPSKPTEEFEIESTSEIHGSNDAEIVNRDPLLLGTLGIEPNSELLDTIQRLKTALANPETPPERMRQLWVEYAVHFEALTAQEPNPEVYDKIQIAAILHKAFIFREAGKILRYTEELDVAEMYARNAGFTDLSTVLDAEVDAKTETLEPSPEVIILKLRGKINDDNREFLRDLWADEQDYEDFVNHIYEMLLEEGEDPEEIMTSLGITES